VDHKLLNVPFTAASCRHVFLFSASFSKVFVFEWQSLAALVANTKLSRTLIGLSSGIQFYDKISVSFFERSVGYAFKANKFELLKILRIIHLDTLCDFNID